MKLIQKPTGQYFDDFNYISSNGTMGVSDIACECEKGYSIYKIFNNYFGMQYIGNWFTWYTKKPTKLYEIFFQSEENAFYNVNFTLQASNDYVNWTTLEITSHTSNTYANIYIYSNNDNYYHYYKLSGFPDIQDRVVQIRISQFYCVSLGSTTASILKPTRKYYKYVDTPWTQPIVTASSSTSTSIITQGHTIYSCWGVRNSGYALSNCFDGSTTGTAGCPIEMSSAEYDWIQIFNHEPIKASEINIYWHSPGSNLTQTSTVIIEASSDGTNWTTLSSGTTSTSARITDIVKHTVDLSNNTNLYNYYRVENTTPYTSNYRYCWYVVELQITATQKTIVECTSSDYDFYEDVNAYMAIV